MKKIKKSKKIGSESLKKEVKVEEKPEFFEMIKPEIKEVKAEVAKVENPKKKSREHKTIKKEEKKSKKIGGGSFILSGIISILTPAMFYIVLGDFNSFLKECALPFSTVNIGNDMIVNCTEIRLVYIISFLGVFFGLILIVWGFAKKIIELKKSV